MSGVRQLLTAYGLDAVIVVAAASAAVGTAQREDSSRLVGTRGWLEVVAITALVLVLVLRRWFPFGAPAAVCLASAALSFADGLLITTQGGAYVAGVVASLLLGNQRTEVQARVGLVVVLGGLAILVYNDPTEGAGGLLATGVLFILVWLVGYALRERAEQAEAAEQRAAQAERDRDAAARVAVAEERARIARELHDVVAHAVSVMVLQVGAVRHRMSDADPDDREALRNVEAAGRTALADMRRLLGALRREDEEAERVPHPGLGELERLLDDVRGAGLQVLLTVRGEPVALPPGLDLSAYRIVQEALTNTLKHASASRAEVTVRYGPGEIEIEVRDDGRGPAGDEPGHGHGLVGIRERVKVFGGEMSTGRSPSGGYVLHARLPWDGEAV